jgi:hypothetical protein
MVVIVQTFFLVFFQLFSFHRNNSFNSSLEALRYTQLIDSTVNVVGSAFSTFQPAAFKEDGSFLSGLVIAMNLFYNGSHFVLFQNDTENKIEESKNAYQVMLFKEKILLFTDEQFPFAILPPSAMPTQYATLKNISWILLNKDKEYGLLGHYFHYIEHLIALWAAFDLNMKTLYPYCNHTEINQWVENIVIGPKMNRKQWLKNGINEFLTNALFPNAKVYANDTDSIISSPLHTNWIKFDTAFIMERRGTGWGSGINKMSSLPLFWALNKDPLVLERFKKHVVDAAIRKTEPYQPSFDNKLQVLYINRQGNARSLTDDAHASLLQLLATEQRIKATVVNMELYTPEEQIKMSHNADVIIGVHGNGLTNGLWMRKGGLLIEILKTGFCIFDYQFIAVASRQHYAGITGDLVLPAFTTEAKDPCLSLMNLQKGAGGFYDLNVTLVHKVLLQFASTRDVGLISSSYVMRPIPR